MSKEQWPEPRKVRYPCPCCGYLTRWESEYGSDDICQVCFWHDCPVQGNDPDFDGGANAPSLNEARANFAEFGAKERRFLKFVRPPRADEIPPDK